MEDSGHHLAAQVFGLVFGCLIQCVAIVRLYVQGSPLHLEMDVKLRFVAILFLFLANMISIILQGIFLYHEIQWATPLYTAVVLFSFLAPACQSVALTSFVMLLSHRYRRFFLILQRTWADIFIRVFVIAFILFNTIKVAVSAGHYYGRLVYQTLPSFIPHDRFPFSAIIFLVSLVTEQYVHFSFLRNSSTSTCYNSQATSRTHSRSIRKKWAHVNRKMVIYSLCSITSAIVMLLLYLLGKYSSLFPTEVVIGVCHSWLIVHALLSFSFLDIFAYQLKQANNVTTVVSGSDVVMTGLVSELKETEVVHSLFSRDRNEL